MVLWLNGLHAPWLDTLMWTVSQSATWIPLYALLVGLLYLRFRDSRRTLVFALLAFALAIGVADYICSGVLKPLVCRPRPTHAPELEGMLHLVRGYTGGMYGFCSSHAANTMACAVLFHLIYQRPAAAWLYLWVAVNCLSRIYLGVHYPTDILAGLAVGTVTAYLAYKLYKSYI